jgi:hypothetical protein
MSFPSPAATRSSERATDRSIGIDVSDQAFDIRLLAHRTPLESAVRAADALRRDVGDLNVTWDDSLGTAKLVFSQNGWLSRPAKGTAVSVARAWLTAHRGLFGLTSQDVARAKVTRDAALPGTGMHPVVLRVMYGSVPTFAGGAVGVNVMPDGRIVTVWANTGPSGSISKTPKLSAADALQTIARRVGASLKTRSLGQRKTGDRLAIFNAGGLFQNHNVRLVAFPTGKGPVLAWRVFFAKAGEELYSSAVDARTGQILYLHNQVKHAEGTVYQNYPGASGGGTQEVVSFDGDPKASPNGWVGLPVPGTAGVPGFTTMGNNALAFTDWAWPKLAPGLLLLALIQANTLPDYAPISPTGNFNYTFENNWAQSCEPTVIPVPAGRTIPVKGNEIESPSFVLDRDPAVTNLFYFANKYHDLLYNLGFTEPMGNYQQDNFGKGGVGLDAVRVGAELGILNNQVDNAFFFPAPDGGEPTSFIDPSDPRAITNYLVAFSGMFLWRPVPGFLAPCADGAFDAHVVWHELTHGMTTRVAGGPDDSDSLNQVQSGSMGEAWSDWWAMHLLHSLGFEKGTTFGPYVTGNKVTGIRHFKLDANPLTYADIGYARRGPEVHDDGEIWSATLWDLRSGLIEKHGDKEGAQRAGHLVFDALTLAGLSNPSFLDQRNGILKGDLARYKGEDTALIWKVFAKRGMGVAAKTKNAADSAPVPSFDIPGSGNATFSGVVTDGDGGVLKGAKIIFGFGEGQPKGTAVTDALGRFSLEIAPGTYNLTIAAAGYGLQPQGAVSFSAGRSVTRTFTLFKNLVSLGYGGKVIGGLAEGDKGLALIDDHEFSGQVVTVGTPVVIQLAGRAPSLVRNVNVSTMPMGGSGDDAATAYIVEVSLDNKKWVKVSSGGIKGAVPRPGVAQWKRQRKALGSLTPARFVRVTVTGTVGGEPPEIDALAQAACDAGRTTFCRAPWTAIIADLQIFGKGPSAVAQKIGGEPDFVENGSITLSNAGGGSGGADASVTENAWLAACTKPQAPVQGLDGYVVELPDGYGDGLHKFALTNLGGNATDLDAYFWDADCGEELGRAATSNANEAATLPPGTKWVLVILFSGTSDGFEVRSATTIERVNAPTRVAGVKQTRPRPSPGGLPATGVADPAGIAFALLLFAIAGRRWIRRAS